MVQSVLESLTQDIWESDYGFIPGKTQTIDFAVNLRTTNALYTPSLSQIIINYKQKPIVNPILIS